MVVDAAAEVMKLALDEVVAPEVVAAAGKVEDEQPALRHGAGDLPADRPGLHRPGRLRIDFGHQRKD